MSRDTLSETIDTRPVSRDRLFMSKDMLSMSSDTLTVSFDRLYTYCFYAICACAGIAACFHDHLFVHSFAVFLFKFAGLTSNLNGCFFNSVAFESNIHQQPS